MKLKLNGQRFDTLKIVDGVKAVQRCMRKWTWRGLLVLMAGNPQLHDDTFGYANLGFNSFSSTCGTVFNLMAKNIWVLSFSVNILSTPVQVVCTNSKLYVCLFSSWLCSHGSVTEHGLESTTQGRCATCRLTWPTWAMTMTPMCSSTLLTWPWKTEGPERAGGREGERGRQKRWREGTRRRVRAREKRSGLETEREEKEVGREWKGRLWGQSGR